MSVFTPLRRWQPSFYPFRRQKFGMRLLARLERLIKGPLFGCRMCGNCLLQETAFICHMQCPKGLRNGPCGGSTAEHCYVDTSRKCVWYLIYKRAKKIGREGMLLEVLPPIDWEKAGTETWADVVRAVRAAGTGKFFHSLIARDVKQRRDVWEGVFRPLRQPDWWDGDSDYHPPVCQGHGSELERRLKAGEFVVTTEVLPPLGANTQKLRERIEMIKPFVAAINFTDNASASPRMSSMACCKVAFEMGAEPVLQVAARDKTRCGLQAELIGANEMGAHNVLCVTGDSPRIGPSPRSDMNILDIDSIQMLWILRKMRDEGKYLDGRIIKNPPHFFLGAASSPFAAEPELQAIREQKKVNAGAQFFQTNIVYEPEKLERWLEQLEKKGLSDKVFVIVGAAPLKNYKMARYLQEEIPGVQIPEHFLKRMQLAGKSAAEEGIQIALETMEKIRHMKGVSGFHLMTFGCENTTKRLILEAGLAGTEMNS